MICPVEKPLTQELLPLNVPVIDVPAAFNVIVPVAFAEQFVVDGGMLATPGNVIAKFSVFPDTVPLNPGV